jgi:4-diphosphocytidyl-2C-methyl-D-erythritol kinase
MQFLIYNSISLFSKNKNDFDIIQMNIKQSLKKMNFTYQESTKTWLATLKLSGSGSSIFSGACASASASTRILPFLALLLSLPLPHHW